MEIHDGLIELSKDDAHVLILGLKNLCCISVESDLTKKCRELYRRLEGLAYD